MDETAIAFEPPHVRARATHAGPPLDRISVRDYVRQVEIGAFRTERGITQRVRFNVVLEVSHHTAAQDDDVDKVISYDTITEAIEHELAAERINLLETLAERVAARCLADPRAVRAFVRIEKLDRIPGALGVEIVRTRLARRGAPAPAGRAAPAEAARRGRGWSTSLPARRPARGGAGATRSRPGAIRSCSASGRRRRSPPPRTEGQRRIGLLEIEQAAWAFADSDPRFGVVATRTELDWAMKSGRLSVWAPSHMAAAAVGQPAADASDPVALAAWLAETLGAEHARRRGRARAAGAPRAAGARRRPAHRISRTSHRRVPMTAASPPLVNFGWRAADFRLADTKGRVWGLDQLRGPKGLVLMFICNHCEYVLAVIDKLVQAGQGAARSRLRRRGDLLERRGRLSRGQLREDGRLRAPASSAVPLSA